MGEAHGKRALAEDDDVHVERLEVRRAERVLVEAAEADEIIRPEQLDLLARLLHLDILRRERVDIEDLRTRTISTAREDRRTDGRVARTRLSIFISSSVGESTSSHHVCPSGSFPSLWSFSAVLELPLLFPLFPPFAYIAPPAALLPWKLLCPFDCGAAGMWIGRVMAPVIHTPVGTVSHV